MGLFRRLLNGMKIRSKFIILEFLVLILSFCVSFVAIYVINERYRVREIGNAGVQTVKALQENLNLVLESVEQFSNLIYFDSNVQAALQQIDNSDIDPVVQQTIQKSLINMILSVDYISTANIFDIYYNDYNSYKIGPIQTQGELIPSTSWYQTMEEAQGNSFFIHGSEDVLSFPTREGKSYISLIREIRDFENYEQLAILLLTIDEETIQECFAEVGQVSGTQFFIMDQKREYIVRPDDMDVNWNMYVPMDLPQESGYELVTVDGRKMVCIYQDMGIEDWSLVGMIPIQEMGFGDSYFYSVIALVLVLNLCFLFLCAIALSKFVFSPLVKMGNHMKLVEAGNFVEMKVDDKNNEISTLKRVFNHMIESIEQLINRVKEEEQIIARNKLDILQAQINPHFLYNTLDAVSALALINDNENCFKMTQALGSFYRNSLNSGKDLVTVRDEISCIKSYITILNIRYDNKITAYYDIEEEIEQKEILKLILQPVVENSIHHGFVEKGHSGTIWIRACREKDELIFTVRDDGCGMSEERIAAIMNGDTKTDKHGFGLYSLIERVSLYYQMENPVCIQSSIGEGTTITIRIRIGNGTK